MEGGREKLMDGGLSKHLPDTHGITRNNVCGHWGLIVHVSQPVEIVPVSIRSHPPTVRVPENSLGEEVRW